MSDKVDHIEWEILQIIPAHSGWMAVYGQELENREIEVVKRPVVCWALVAEIVVIRDERKETGRRKVQGIEHLGVLLDLSEDTIIFDRLEKGGVDPNQYFLGYEAPHHQETEKDWEGIAEDHLELERQKRSK